MFCGEQSVYWAGQAPSPAVTPLLDEPLSDVEQPHANRTAASQSRFLIFICGVPCVSRRSLDAQTSAVERADRQQRRPTYQSGAAPLGPPRWLDFFEGVEARAAAAPITAVRCFASRRDASER